MNEENKNSITYDENWQTVSQSEYPEVTLEPFSEQHDNSGDVSNTKRPNTFLLLTIQLIACLVIALAAFIIKNIGGELYTQTHKWYTANLNASAIFDSNNSLDLSNIFSQSTPDEI